MAAKGSRGSFILEILIVLLALLVIAVIIVPNQIWEEESQTTIKCRENVNAIYEAERFHYQKTGAYTDTFSNMLTAVLTDSGLMQRQTLVSLTQSFMQVVENILSIQSVETISKISQASFEVTGDLFGNERYFRRYENIAQTSQEIIREMTRLDSSIAFPNFSRVKLFVDSLRFIKESVSDYPLQIAIFRSINYVDSLKEYFFNIEKDAFNQFWSNEYKKISNFITDIRATDISKVSTVPDRLKKFIDQINNNVQILDEANFSDDASNIENEKQNLMELHKKFLSPEFFILTKRYSLTALNEIDSILIHLSQDDFLCPDSKEPYLIDTTRRRLTVECPNLLNVFHQKFSTDLEPIKNIPVYQQISDLSKVIDSTKSVLDINRAIVRRNIEVLIQIKELMIEFEEIDNVFFYRYVNEINEFIELMEKEIKLSVIKPAIENILNPMDTLATRIDRVNVSDLEKKLNYFNDKLKNLDSMVANIRLPARARRQVISNSEPFQQTFEIVNEIKSHFKPEYAEAFRKTSKSLEKNLLEALEGENEARYLIFNKKHDNHGYIKGGEKSWEEEK